jgi:hypothetical protein
MFTDKWYDNSHVFIHEFYNKTKNSDKHYKIYSKAKEILDQVQQQVSDKLNVKIIKKYLSGSVDKDGNIVYQLDDFKLTDLTVKSGWFVLLSNFVNDNKEAINLYRSKGVVEKGFLDLRANWT